MSVIFTARAGNISTLHMLEDTNTIIPSRNIKAGCNASVISSSAHPPPPLPTPGHLGFFENKPANVPRWGH